MRHVIHLTTFGIVTLFALSAAADPRDPAAAEALFRAGRTAAEKGDYTTACARFEDSRRLDPTLGTAFNLADCDEHVGKYASAWQLFKEVAQRLPSGDDRIGVANGRAAALEPRLPKLVMKVRAPLPPQSALVRDGVDLGSGVFDVPLPIDPGEHSIVVKSPGRAERQYKVTVAEGQTTEMWLEPGAPLPPEPTPTANRGVNAKSSEGGNRTMGAVLLGLGTAGLATSAIAGAMTLSSKKTVESGCDANKNCTPEAIDAGDRGRTTATVSTVAFGVGLAAAVGGIYFLLARGSEGKSVESSTSVSMAVVPGQAFISVKGRL